MFDSFRYSLTDWNGFDDSPRFVGLENFRRIFTDPLFFNSLINTAIWMGAALAVPTIGGLALALLLDSRVRGARIFKSIFYLPICLASVVVGQIWIWIFQPDWGLLNEAIRSAGHLSPKQFHWAWLAEPRTALACVILGLVVAADRAQHGDFPCRPHVDSERTAGGGGDRQCPGLEEDAAYRAPDAAASDGRGSRTVNDRRAENLRYPLHHDRRWSVPFVRHARSLHVQRVVPEVQNGLWQFHFCRTVPDLCRYYRSLLPAGRQAGGNL